MSLCSDFAVVLRRLDFSETSQVLVFFTRAHGQVRLIAKGIKRSTRTRYAAAIDLLELGQAVWSVRPDRQRSLSPLTEWRQVNGFSGVRTQLQALYAAQYAAEITSDLTAEDDPHPRLFDALVTALSTLAAAPQAPLAALCAYQQALLEQVGLMPATDCCQECRRVPSTAIPLYFSSRQGGLLCRDCEAPHVEKRRIRRKLALALSRGQVPEALAADGVELLNYHITHLMHKPPRLAAFVLPRSRRPTVP